MNLLFVAHAGQRDVRVRGIEIARRLARRHKVFYLIWDARKRTGYGLDFNNVRYGLSQWLRRTRLSREDGVTFVNASKLFAPIGIASRYNSWVMKRLLRQLDIDVVINAAPLLHPVQKSVGRVYIFDLVDDLPAYFSQINPDFSSQLEEHVRTYLSEELRKADVVTACSRRLVALASEQYGVACQFVPNGADVVGYRSVAGHEVEYLRQRLGLSGKYVIGCIGNHRFFSGLAFLVEVFAQLRERVPDAALLVVGPGEEADELARKTPPPPGVLFTGPLPPDVMPLYYGATDIGTIPFEVSPYTSNAFPLKAIEYGAARKAVISTPLQELIDARLPHITFVPQVRDAWVEALVRARDVAWDHRWDAAIEHFDWDEAAATMEQAILSCM